MKGNIATLCLIFALLPVFSQSDLEVGGWKNYFSYSNGLDLQEYDGKIYLATTNALCLLDLADGVYSSVDITNGLSDVGLSQIHLNESTSTMLVCYSNSNLDLYENGRTYNIPDLKIKQMPGDKSIYNACVSSQYAYLACGFGVMVLDLKARYIKETWNFQKNNVILPVYDICLLGDTVFAATSQGIYVNSLSNRRIAQFSTWEKACDSVLSDSIVVKQMVSYRNSVFAFEEGTWQLYVYNGGKWRKDANTEVAELRDVRVSRDRMIVTYWNKSVAYTASDKGFLTQANAFGSPLPHAAICDEEGYLWIADGEHGLVRQLWTDQPSYYTMEGPIKDGVWAMDASKSVLAVVHEASHSSWTPQWSQIKLSIYKDNAWTNVPVDIKYRDAIDILLPSDYGTDCYISSYLHGLLYRKGDGTLTLYDTLNSTLQSYSGTIRAGRICMDEDANLWILNSLVDNSLSVKTAKGEWYSYNTVFSTGEFVGSILVDKRGWIWLTGGKETKLMIYDHNGTLANTADDRKVLLNTTLTEETGAFTYIYSLAEDKDGEIWLGTDKGIKIYYSPSRLIDYPNTLPYAPRVTMDSLTELLLFNEAISCIKVDQGNRKWVGTENAGIFLLSEDGETELLHFNTENSPLISNNIKDIAIIGSSGEVFIGTDKGLQSFRYTSSDPEDDYEKLKIFPNPVREGYTGYITIMGLVDESEVKITDARGGLVYRTTSNGGTAVWDGNRFDGKRAATGVYFVHVSDAAGKEKACGKILFIK